MKTMKKLPVFGTAFLIAASLGNAYADDNEMSQTRIQDHLHTNMDLQTPTTDFGQDRDRDRDRVREHEMEEDHNQYRNEYKYMNRYQTRQNSAGADSMSRQYTRSHSTSGNRR